MVSLIFEHQIVFYFQLFLSANVRHNRLTQEKNTALNFFGSSIKLVNL